MAGYWSKHNLTPPVLLANKDNKAVLKTYNPDSNTVTPEQEHALENTSRGGVKATKIAGDILNNKSEKKGHHNEFRFWWVKNVGQAFTFPGTSNVRFQSYCEAAGVLLLHLNHFLKFLEHIKSKKQNRRFSNMEQNLWDALHCPATKTELAVLALYAQAVSHPYM
jgi:hypothetical protein